MEDCNCQWGKWEQYSAQESVFKERQLLAKFTNSIYESSFNPSLGNPLTLMYIRWKCPFCNATSLRIIILWILFFIISNISFSSYHLYEDLWKRTLLEKDVIGRYFSLLWISSSVEKSVPEEFKINSTFLEQNIESEGQIFCVCDQCITLYRLCVATKEWSL